MSLHSQPVPPIPNQTVTVAHLAFPRGNLHMTMRDELGTLYCDADFTALYSPVGQPAFSTWRLALVTVMQFVENLSDRQAADAVRASIVWKSMLAILRLDVESLYS